MTIVAFDLLTQLGKTSNCALIKFLLAPNSFPQVRGPRLYRHSLGRQLLDAPVGHKVLQLQRPATDEAEGRAQRRRAVHVALPQDTQRVRVVVGDPPFLAVQAHTQPGGQWGGVGVGRPAVAAAVGVQRPLAVALTVALVAGSVSLREQDLAHSYCEEVEGGRVLTFLCSAVMATVRVTAGGWGREDGKIYNNCTMARYLGYLKIPCFANSTPGLFQVPQFPVIVCQSSVLQPLCHSTPVHSKIMSAVL